MLDDPARSPRDVRAEHPKPEAWVRCRVCKAEVARIRDQTELGELNVFVNPAGHVFELALFRHAPGAVARGEPSFEFSWFPGHAWRFAHCRGCGVQLGWRFEGSSQFWGLNRGSLAWP